MKKQNYDYNRTFAIKHRPAGSCSSGIQESSSNQYMTPSNAGYYEDDENSSYYQASGIDSDKDKLIDPKRLFASINKSSKTYTDNSNLPSIEEFYERPVLSRNLSPVQSDDDKFSEDGSSSFTGSRKSDKIKLKLLKQTYLVKHKEKIVKNKLKNIVKLTEQDLEESNCKDISIVDISILGQLKAPPQSSDRPTRGMVMMILSTIFMVGANVFSKLQFEQDKTLGVLELLFARGVISLIILFLWLNKRSKSELIDTIERKNLLPLIFRCISGGLVQVISFSSLKYFNVSTVGMVCSLAPICVCIMAYFILHERMGNIDILFLLAVFCSVIMVLIGTGKDNGGGGGCTVMECAKEGPTLLATISLGILPLLVAGQVIANRQMRSLSETVVSVYVQLTLTIVIGVHLLAQGASFDFISNFSAYAWFLLISSSFVNLLSSITKFLASKYHSASSLQKLAFLPNVWQFMFDLTYMGWNYSGLELTGFSSLFICYGIYLTWFGFTSCLKKKDDDDNYQKEQEVEPQSPMFEQCELTKTNMQYNGSVSFRLADATTDAITCDEEPNQSFRFNKNKPDDNFKYV